MRSGHRLVVGLIVAVVVSLPTSALAAGEPSSTGSTRDSYEATASAVEAPPEVVDPRLKVTTVVDGLDLPMTVAFLGRNDLLVLEKNSGKVVRVVDGTVRSTVLDLSVNNASERGLLGIALHPRFPTVPFVYLYWTCRATVPPAGSQFVPEQPTCSNANLVGPDGANILQVPLLGNRLDRFRWTGTRLVFDRHLLTLRAFQNDGAPTPPGQGDSAGGPHGQQPPLGNHDGGVLRFGSDGKLYLIYGDQGRRGALQNLPCGPTAIRCPGRITPDDQFGGPSPDNAHFSGVIIRLNDDGTTPPDNPFFAAGRAIGGQAGANIRRIYAYGIRNSFGMAFDPLSGRLWEEENGEDAFDEINRVDRGMNGGWIQFMGPASRIRQFRQIESTSLNGDVYPNLQQYRWNPGRIAGTSEQAFARLYRLRGSRYSDPEFSWKYIVALAAIGFVRGSALGSAYAGDLLVGQAEDEVRGGVLFRFDLTTDRLALRFRDPRLRDRVADNRAPDDLTESQSLVLGTGFGIVTDIQTAPDGSVYVVSLSRGAIYRISRA